MGAVELMPRTNLTAITTEGAGGETRSHVRENRRSSLLGTWLQRLTAQRKSRRRGQQRLAALHESDAVVVSYGKSGRTWLRAQLSSLYHQRYGVPESELIDSGNFYRRDQRIPRILFTHAGSREPWAPEQALTVIADKKMLFLARDPRDVAVSLYYQRAKRTSPEGRARAGFADGTDGLPLFDFLVEHNGGAVLKVVRFLNEWNAILPRLPGALRITYEGMQAQPHATLQRVVAHLDQPFTVEEIDHAIVFASFDSLRQKEQAGFFRSSKLRPGNPDDPQSFKVRRGKIGGWRDELTVTQAAEIDRIVERELVPLHLARATQK